MLERYAVGLFVRLSVTSLCSTDTAKLRITQTTPRGMDASFLDAKDLAVKLKRGHPQRRRQMQVKMETFDKSNSKAATVASVVNLVRSHVYHTERPPMFAATEQWLVGDVTFQL